MISFIKWCWGYLHVYWLLWLLGNSSDEIASRLLVQECFGEASWGICPVEKYLRQHGILCTVSDWCLWTSLADQYSRVSLPESVSYFLIRFRGGDYPHLQLKEQ